MTSSSFESQIQMVLLSQSPMVKYSTIATIFSLPRTISVPSTSFGTKTKVPTLLMSKTMSVILSTSLIVLSIFQNQNESNTFIVFTLSWMLTLTSKFPKKRLKRSVVPLHTAPLSSYMVIHTYPVYIIGSQSSLLNISLATCGSVLYPTSDGGLSPLNKDPNAGSCLNSTKIHEVAVIRPDGRVRIPRRPRKDALIAPSSHHPHVLASEHVLLWTTPHGFNFQHELEQLFPESDILKMFFVTIQSLDENTCSNYGAGLLRFTQYCDQRLIPEMQCMPASAALLSAFIADSAGSISDSTASNWLAGLHFWHTINGAIWNGSDSALLHHIKCGLTCLIPPNSK